MEEVIEIIINIVLTVVCAAISFFQFRNKGFLFNNSYIYASKQERETMDKKPHYRQSGIVLALLSYIHLCMAAECILKTGWLWWIVGILCIAVLTYAIISSIKEIRK